MVPGPWPRRRVRRVLGHSTGRHGPLGALGGLRGTDWPGSTSAPRRSSIKVMGRPQAVAALCPPRPLPARARARGPASGPLDTVSSARTPASRVILVLLLQNYLKSQ